LARKPRTELISIFSGRVTSRRGVGKTDAGLRRQRIFPGQSIAFRKALDAQLSEHEQQLRSMMHPMRGQVDNRTSERFPLRWVIERVQKRLVKAVLIGGFTSELEELRRGDAFGMKVAVFSNGR
jgi:hypothetical protein